MKDRFVLLLATVLVLATLGFAEDIKIVKGPIVEHAGMNSAVIAWSTNNSSATIVKYGTDPNHLDKRAEMPWGALTHRVMLKNLQPNTTYYFQADSGQGGAGGSGAISEVEKFSTPGQNAGNRSASHPELKIVNGPVLDHVGDTTATVAWTTTLPSSAVVRYGTDSRNLSKNAEEPWGATDHKVELKNLKPNTRYYFIVHSAQGKNAPGQVQETQPQEFTTAAPGQRANR